MYTFFIRIRIHIRYRSRFVRRTGTADVRTGGANDIFNEFAPSLPPPLATICSQNLIIISQITLGTRDSTGPRVIFGPFKTRRPNGRHRRPPVDAVRNGEVQNNIPLKLTPLSVHTLDAFMSEKIIIIIFFLLCKTFLTRLPALRKSRR